MKKNLLSRLGKTLSLVEGYRCCRKSSCRHPEFISGSRESKEMLKQVQHDDCLLGQMLNPVQHDDNRMEWVPNPTQHDGCRRMGQTPHQAQNVGWRRTSLSLGRSMIEILGVLAIIGVLSIGGLYAYRQAMDKYKLNQLFQELSLIELAVRDYCSTKENCVGVWNNIPEARRIVCMGTGICTDKLSSYGGQFAPTLGNYSQSTDFSIYLYHIPKNFCKPLIEYPWKNLHSIQTNQGVVPAPLDDAKRESLLNGCMNGPYIRLYFIWFYDGSLYIRK